MKLTNGGKPHVCGQIAVHNCTKKDAVVICSNCGLGVDCTEDNKTNMPQPTIERCLQCIHELCRTCQNCHNMDCEVFMQPYKSCFDALLPKKEIDTEVEQIKMLYRPVVDLDNGGVRIEPNFKEADKALDKLWKIVERLRDLACSQERKRCIEMVLKEIEGMKLPFKVSENMEARSAYNQALSHALDSLKEKLLATKEE